MAAGLLFFFSKRKTTTKETHSPFFFLGLLTFPKSLFIFSITACDNVKVDNGNEVEEKTEEQKEEEKTVEEKYIEPWKKGKTIEVDNFDENRFEECTSGIHFFLNRDNAVSYEM